MPTGIVYDEQFAQHKGPVNHPERPERTTLSWKNLQDTGLVDKCTIFPSRTATIDEILAVHSEELLSLLDKPVDELTLLKAQGMSDTYICPATSVCARLAAGSLIDISLSVWKGTVDSALALIRPPGHHCGVNTPSGFCLLNNVALATKALQAAGAEKVLIVDWDVHHGNGTQEIFWDDPSVVFFSVHGYCNKKFFPYSGGLDEVGGEKARGKTINVPLPGIGFGDTDYVMIWQHLLAPIIKEFQPDIILVSAGFDAGLGDPLGKMQVSPEGFAVLLNNMMEWSTNGKIVLALEGGYNTSTVSYSVEACLKTLLRLPVDSIEQAEPKKQTQPLIDEVTQGLKLYWPNAFGS